MNNFNVLTIVVAPCAKMCYSFSTPSNISLLFKDDSESSFNKQELMHQKEAIPVK